MQRYQKHCNIQIFYRNFFEKKTYFVKKTENVPLFPVMCRSLATSVLSFVAKFTELEFKTSFAYDTFFKTGS